MDARSLTLIVALLAGCTSEAEKRAQAEQAAALVRTQAELAALKAKEAAAEEARARREKAKQDLLSNPTAWFEATNVEFFDKGIINTYRELVRVSLMNKSHFAVRDIRGTVQWLSENGDQIASVDFSVPGSIPAGDTKTFSKANGTLSSTTIQTDAKSYRVTVTKVVLVER